MDLIMRDPHRQRGFSLTETLIAAAMMLIALMAAMVYISSSVHGTRHNKDKSFAVQKAISILEELKGMVETTEGDAASLLDDKDDGTLPQSVLTTLESVTQPDHASSGNVWVDGKIQ